MVENPEPGVRYVAVIQRDIGGAIIHTGTARPGEDVCRDGKVYKCGDYVFSPDDCDGRYYVSPRDIYTLEDVLQALNAFDFQRELAAAARGESV